jgi:large subunit ribosomal protein L6
MKEKIEETVEIPSGIELELKDSEIIVKKGTKESKKSFNLKNLELKREGNKIVISAKKATKREKTMINTIKAHINNMIKGLDEDYVYKLEVVYLHFPITLEMDKSNNKLIIKNFLGEKKPRICNIVPGAEVELGKNLIIITSHDKEVAGQTMANIEKATKIRNRDRRKFQDGIFMTERAGRAI